MSSWPNASARPHIPVAIICSLLFAAVMCEQGLAQSQPVQSTQSIPLTLKDAVKLVLKQNPQVVATRLLSL